MSTTPSAPADATTSARGLMSASDKTKLDAQSGTNTGDVTVSSPAGWLSRVGQALTFALVSASASVAGVVDLAAQTFAGAKTFTSAIIASAGVQVASLFNTNGTGASDVGVKVGFSTAAGSINGGAKPFSVRYGLNGGTEVEQVYVDAYGNLFLNVQANGSGTQTLYAYAAAGGKVAAHFQGPAATAAMRITQDGVGTCAHLMATGRFDQWGTDSSASPGAASISKPTGKSAIASGATSVVITNTLCAAASRVMVTFHADPGSRYWVVPAAGSFTVNLSSAAPGNVAFSWEVSNIL